MVLVSAIPNFMAGKAIRLVLVHQIIVVFSILVFFTIGIKKQEQREKAGILALFYNPLHGFLLEEHIKTFPVNLVNHTMQDWL
jgi:hypothetical protein